MEKKNKWLAAQKVSPTSANRGQSGGKNTAKPTLTSSGEKRGEKGGHIISTETDREVLI